MKTIKVIMDQRLDAVDLLDTDMVELTTTYMGSVVNKSVPVSDLSASEKSNLKDVIDTLTFELEANALVWKIANDTKSFDLSKSYLRNAKDTTALDELDVDTPLIVVFEFATFSENKLFELSLWYDNEFLSAELDDLEALGVTVTGDGKSFAVTNNCDVKISFKKPQSALEIYVIDFAPLIIEA